MANEYVQSIAKRLMGERVEVCLGMDYDTLLYSDNEVHRKAVVVGVLVDFDDCLFVVDCDGILVYINSWQIVGITSNGSWAKILAPSKGGAPK